jgi:inward rectifier potassium channel
MKTMKDPGLGSKFQKPIKRMMNQDGTYNIIRKGGLTKFQDFYKYLLDVSLGKFLLIILLIYILLNIVFTCIYLGIGIEELKGVSEHQPAFFSAFFFSTQTFTTVGYGSVSPHGIGAEIVAMVEAFVGLLGFALATGLLYGRFSKPNAKIGFSKNIILTPFDEGQAIMFKTVNLRNNVLLKTKISVFIALDKEIGANNFMKEYFPLTLEVDTITFFPLTWTLVHKITEDSPVANMNIDELKLKNAEVFILIETFDETYSQDIVQKHSYAQNDWIDNVKFDTNFRTNTAGNLELHVNELDKLITLN